MKSFFTAICPLLLVWPAVLYADNEDSSLTDKQARDQLKQIEQQVEEQDSELRKFHNRAKQLELRVECNWSLLRGYEGCEDEYGKTNTGYANCLAGVKNTFKECSGDLAGDGE